MYAAKVMLERPPAIWRLEVGGNRSFGFRYDELENGHSDDGFFWH